MEINELKKRCEHILLVAPNGFYDGKTVEEKKLIIEIIKENETLKASLENLKADYLELDKRHEIIKRNYAALNELCQSKIIELRNLSARIIDIKI